MYLETPPKKEIRWRLKNWRLASMVGTALGLEKPQELEFFLNVEMKGK